MVPGTLQIKTTYGNNGTNGRRMSVDEVISEVEKDEVFYDESGGGVTFSGGEPFIQFDFLKSLLTESKNRNIATAVDTSGFAETEKFEAIYDLVDLFLFDLKVIDEQAHLEYTGKSNEVIHQNLSWLANKGEKVMLRIPLIPNITDTTKNLAEIIKFTQPFPTLNKISLLPYNMFSKAKYHKFNLENKLQDLKTQTPEKLKLIRHLFEEHNYTIL
jgi:pyruvate formate lyase activating enzyme